MRRPALTVSDGGGAARTRLTGMAHGQEKLIEALRDLAATCRDAEEGYNKAAKGVHNDDSRTIFDKYSQERAQFARELDQHVTRLGGEPGEAGHGGGVLRRGWVDLEQRIRPKEDREIIENCADGEEGSLSHYARALGLPLDEEVRRTLRQQEAAIRAAVEHLRGVATRR
ncbi:MAG TPA: PA2169 family four-helix-bundle protein [Bryobacteraceae bacterium]|nr:PA2169 family four-helix-bundle protein [Bryobacteraceae bacterium]